MELADPTLSEAFKKCVDQGATSIVCHPYFLSKGRHVKEDIPRLMSEAASEFPTVPYTITEPLGVQDSLLDLIHDAISLTIINT